MQKNKREMNLAPWEQGFCWYWHNDEEIFSYTDEDFERDAEALAARGVTIILTFSLTHYRFGYYPYWEEINESLRKMVRAFHKWGIRVVEHHSSHLTNRLLDEDGWENLDREFFTRTQGRATYDRWKKIFPFLTYDYKIWGKDIRSFAQIDGRTGEPVRNVYGTYSMCFNNPDYRETYFKYMESVVATGIDGIMNDDVQYFGDGHGCACEHCRKKFKETYGYDIPDSDGWSSFYENYDNPAYVAWKKFKFDSTKGFYLDLSALYERLGVKLLRPNYCSDILKHNPTCYAFDRATEIWDFIFQENCFSAVMKESYMDFMTEAIHRYAAARRRGVPSMSMFYPDRADSVYFSWALSRAWGQLYTGTSEGVDITALEAPYRTFEKKYMRYYTAPDKRADVSFFFSHRTRDFTADARRRYTRHMMGSMQAAYVAGLSLDMVMENDTVEELSRHRVILASYCAMLSDGELSRLAAYVRGGGRLLILGDFAIYDADGRTRDASRLEALLGVSLADDTPVSLGKGEILRYTYRPSECDFQPTVWCDRRVPNPVPVPAVPSKWEAQRRGTGALLLSGIAPRVRVGGAERVVVSAYDVKGARVLHLVNLADTVSESTDPVSHKSIIPNFAQGAKRLDALCLRLSDAPEDVTSVRLITPERADEVLLTARREAADTVIDVPADTFAAYAMVVLECEKS